MIQIGQKLNIQPQKIRDIVQRNLNNEDLKPLITEKRCLETIPLELNQLQDVEFFIRYVFKIVREPYKKEIDLLKQFARTCQNQNLKELAQLLIHNENHMKKQDFGKLLNQIHEALEDKHFQLVKILVKNESDQASSLCRQLIKFLTDDHEEGEWSQMKFKKTLLKMMNEAFGSLTLQIKQIFLEIVGILLCRSLEKERDYAELTFLLRNLMEQYKNQTVFIAKTIHKRINEEWMPNFFMSKAIFFTFSSIFNNEVYFDQNLQNNFEPVTKLAQELFDILHPTFDVVELGWISIFSLDKIISLDTFQQDLHVCSSILRQLWHQSQILSECFCYILTIFIQKKSISENILQLESILTILTPKQLKYIIMKLNTVLSEGKKEQIIIEAMKIKSKAMESCAYHFLINLGEQISDHKKIWREMRSRLEDQHFDLQKQMQQSRYNSFEKEQQHFLSSYKFIINYDISESDIVFKTKLADRLLFYKHLFQNDYFSEQYWVNEEKMSLFDCEKEDSIAKLSIVCEFLSQHKVNNLSGVMLLTQAIKNTKQKTSSLGNENFLIKMVQILGEVCLETLQKDKYVSNLLIALNFLVEISKIQIGDELQAKAIQIFRQKYSIKDKSPTIYTRIHFAVQFITFSFVKRTKNMSDINSCKQLLLFYSKFVLKGQNFDNNNQYIKQIAELQLSSVSFSNSNYSARLFQQKTSIKTKICRVDFNSLRDSIQSIADEFRFQLPIFKEQIIYLTYIAHSAEDNYYFRNHFVPFLNMEFVKILSKTISKTGDKTLLKQIFKKIMNLLTQILEGDTYSHKQSFYRTLKQSQICYNLCTSKIISSFDVGQLAKIVDICLKIIRKDNYPLLRQYIETVMCRCCLAQNRKTGNNNRRRQMIDMVHISLNIGVPVILTLGYELIEYCRHPEMYKDCGEHILSIHQFLVKFISCHTAYLRTICQYYLNLYIELMRVEDTFLVNLGKFWKEDKDSQKIMKNVSVVVQGFRQAVEQSVDFLGFQRVEEYPTNRVKMEMYRRTALFYSEQIIGEIRMSGIMNENLLQAYTEAAQERYIELKSQYLKYFAIFADKPEERTFKSNTKLKGEVQIVEKPKEKVEQKPKESKKEQKKHKNKDKKEVKPKHVQKPLQVAKIQQIEYLQEIQYKLKTNFQLETFSNWCQRNLNPTIIVIATLLQKVHNFGHILRTLNGHNAMLVVPSQQPLKHQQCEQLVPPNCDVQIVEIRRRDLSKFIVMMKNLKYPLVALQQCSRSVQLEEVQFPSRFMLLLGNQRLGAPSKLLNQGDILVEIPQIGKIRSLNVHVSMVLCLWQYLSSLL